MKLQKKLVLSSVLIGGGLLAIFVDGATLAYVVCLVTLALTVAFLFGIRPASQHSHDQSSEEFVAPAVHYAAVTFVSWTFFSVLFGIRAYQVLPEYIRTLGIRVGDILSSYIQPEHTQVMFTHASEILPPYILLVAGFLLCWYCAHLWFPQNEKKRMLERVLALVMCEWFIVLLFAPGGFMVLGALFAIAFTVCGMISEYIRLGTVTAKSVATTTVLGAIIGLIFIVGFRWAL